MFLKGAVAKTHVCILNFFSSGYINLSYLLSPTEYGTGLTDMDILQAGEVTDPKDVESQQGYNIFRISASD